MIWPELNRQVLLYFGLQHINLRILPEYLQYTKDYVFFDSLNSLHFL
nr:MAG TPA: hypothetical protein [Caudoviricetes sp.]